jgi:hypothetical protein
MQTAGSSETFVNFYETAQCHNLHDSILLKTETANSSETLVRFYGNICRHIPEDSILPSQYHEKLNCILCLSCLMKVVKDGLSTRTLNLYSDMVKCAATLM